MNITYIDSNGYQRYKYDNELIHRKIAYKYCKHHPGLNFANCEVHHIDKNKLNNHYNNLIILTQYEHLAMHNDNKSIKETLISRKKNKIKLNKWRNKEIIGDLKLFDNEYEHILKEIEIIKEEERNLIINEYKKEIKIAKNMKTVIIKPENEKLKIIEPIKITKEMEIAKSIKEWKIKINWKYLVKLEFRIILILLTIYLIVVIYKFNK